MDTGTRDLRIAIDKWARNLEPRLLDGPAAARELRRGAGGKGSGAAGRGAAGELRRVARMKAIVASVETRLARRVEETNTWQRGGHRSAAHFVAQETGTSVHHAGVTRGAPEPLQELAV